MELEDKIAVVTGSSRGVGQAIAVELARRGADVVLAARSFDETIPEMPGTLMETKTQIEALGRAAFPVRADLNDLESVESLANSAVEWKGGVDILVNNAAFLGRAAYYDLDQTEIRHWTAQLTVNLTAPYLLTKLLVPSMRSRGGGAIVNITSGSGLIGEYDVPGIGYGTTKAALNRLTTLLARDLEPDGIAVFAVDPGYTRTALVEQTATAAGLDASDAHSTAVPAGVVADLLQADSGTVSGRIFAAREASGPLVVADSHEPMPEGYELDLS
jgi:NAD(P)-dependent dehydrogenase (short-subunit alcohol dehydrogenase family)